MALVDGVPAEMAGAVLKDGVHNLPDDVAAHHSEVQKPAVDARAPGRLHRRVRDAGDGVGVPAEADQEDKVTRLVVVDDEAVARTQNRGPGSTDCGMALRPRNPKPCYLPATTTARPKGDPVL